MTSQQDYGGAYREMTLVEWVDRLPEQHKARVELSKLEAENARLRAEVEDLENKLFIYKDSCASLNDALEASSTERADEHDENIRLRTHLALAEAVCEAVNEFWDTARDDDTLPFKVVRALEKWREGKG